MITPEKMPDKMSPHHKSQVIKQRLLCEKFPHEDRKLMDIQTAMKKVQDEIDATAEYSPLMFRMEDLMKLFNRRVELIGRDDNKQLKTCAEHLQMFDAENIDNITPREPTTAYDNIIIEVNDPDELVKIMSDFKPTKKGVSAKPDPVEAPVVAAVNPKREIEQTNKVTTTTAAKPVTAEDLVIKECSIARGALVTRRDYAKMKATDNEVPEHIDNLFKKANDDLMKIYERFDATKHTGADRDLAIKEIKEVKSNFKNEMEKLTPKQTNKVAEVKIEMNNKVVNLSKQEKEIEKLKNEIEVLGNPNLKNRH